MKTKKPTKEHDNVMNLIYDNIEKIASQYIEGSFTVKEISRQPNIYKNGSVIGNFDVSAVFGLSDKTCVEYNFIIMLDIESISETLRILNKYTSTKSFSLYSERYFFVVIDSETYSDILSQEKYNPITVEEINRLSHK